MREIIIINIKGESGEREREKERERERKREREREGERLYLAVLRRACIRNNRVPVLNNTRAYWYILVCITHSS